MAENCGACGSSIPFLKGRAAQQPQGQDLSRFRGIQLVRVSLSPPNLNEPYPVWEGPFYGFTVLSFTSTPTQLDLYLGKPQRDVDGTFGPAIDATIQGTRYESPSDLPVSQGLYAVKTGSVEARFAIIAIATQPGSLKGWTPTYLVGPSGSAGPAYQNADADTDFAALLVGMLVNARLSGWDSSVVDWLRIEARDAGSSADFGTTLPGMLVNARMATLRVSSGNWEQMRSDVPSTINGEGHSAQIYTRMASLLFGRDTGDSTLRAIEARAATAGQAATLYRLLTDAAVRIYDPVSGLYENLQGDRPSAILAGRIPSIIRNAWTNSVGVRYDTQGTLLFPTPTERSVTATPATAAAGVVLATLDAQAMVHKSAYVTSTEAGTTVDVQVSRDGTSWVALLAGIAVGAATVFVINTALALEQAKGFRHVRVVSAGIGFAAPVTCVISAQGE